MEKVRLSTSDKVWLYLKRNKRSIEWLAGKFDMHRNTIAYKLENNSWTLPDISLLEQIEVIKD